MNKYVNSKHCIIFYVPQRYLKIENYALIFKALIFNMESQVSHGYAGCVATELMYLGAYSNPGNKEYVNKFHYHGWNSIIDSSITKLVWTGHICCM